MTDPIEGSTSGSSALACNLVSVDAGGLLAVVNGHFNAGSSVTVLTSVRPGAVFCIGQHSCAAPPHSVITAINTKADDFEDEDSKSVQTESVGPGEKGFPGT